MACDTSISSWVIHLVSWTRLDFKRIWIWFNSMAFKYKSKFKNIMWYLIWNKFNVCKHNLTENNYILALGIRTVTSAIDGRFKAVESQDPDECECALEALGNIGSCKSAFIYRTSILGNSVLWNKIPHHPFSYIQMTIISFMILLYRMAFCISTSNHPNLVWTCSTVLNARAVSMHLEHVFQMNL